MAEAAGVSAEAGLLHRLDDEWLWVAPHRAVFAYGIIPIREAAGASRALAAMNAACPSLSEHQIYYSSVMDESPPPGSLPWSPFSVTGAEVG
jgi:pilus assembly protein HofM